MKHAVGKGDKVYQAVLQGYNWHHEKEFDLLTQYQGLILGLIENNDVAALLSVHTSLKDLLELTEGGIKGALENIRSDACNTGLSAFFE